MAKKTDSKDKSGKPFDVSKPGETPASATARPVIVGHAPMIKKDPMVRDSSDQPEEKTEEESRPPIQTRQIKIEPLNKEPAKEEPEPQDTESPEKPAEDKAEATAADTTDKPEVKEEKDQAKPESGAVEALAGEVTAKREEQKQKEAAEAKAKELEKIIESKEFFIPIGQAARRRSVGRFIITLIILIILAIVALNFMVDAEMLDSGVEPLTDWL